MLRVFEVSMEFDIRFVGEIFDFRFLNLKCFIIQARIGQLVAYPLGTGEVPCSNLAMPIDGKGCERGSGEEGQLPI